KVCCGVLRRKPRDHKEISILSKRPEPSCAAMIGITVDYCCRREFLDRSFCLPARGFGQRIDRDTQALNPARDIFGTFPFGADAKRLKSPAEFLCEVCDRRTLQARQSTVDRCDA